MDVFLNELCLVERPDFIDLSTFTNQLKVDLKSFNNQGFNIYSNLLSFEDWLNNWGIDYQNKTYILRLLNNYVNEVNTSEDRFYYHHFRHQDYNLSVGFNISTTSVAAAAKLVEANVQCAILNIPISDYCYREYLPIIKSPHISKEVDKLINVPCFINSKEIINYYYLHNKIKHLISKDKFAQFEAEFKDFHSNFDISKSELKKLDGNGKTIPESAFPVISKPAIKDFLSSITIPNMSNEEKINFFKNTGDLVLKIHGYIENSQLSAHYKRHIYEGGKGNKKLLISLDIENGGFEVIDGLDGTHLGVHGYDGKHIKKYTKQLDINSHSLTDLPRTMLLFE